MDLKVRTTVSFLPLIAGTVYLESALAHAVPIIMTGCAAGIGGYAPMDDIAGTETDTQNPEAINGTFPKQGTLIWTPQCYNPFYRDSQKGTRNSGEPFNPIRNILL